MIEGWLLRNTPLALKTDPVVIYGSTSPSNRSSLGSRSKALREGKKKHRWRSFPVNKYPTSLPNPCNERENKCKWRVNKFLCIPNHLKQNHPKFTLTKMSDKLWRCNPQTWAPGLISLPGGGVSPVQLQQSSISTKYQIDSICFEYKVYLGRYHHVVRYPCRYNA